MKRILPLIILILPGMYSCKPRKVVTEEPVVRNIILFIGDGMGVAHLTAGLTANGGSLALEKCTYAGFQKTFSSDSYITDSGAGGTAIATGVKTRNGMIGMAPDSTKLKTILELAEEKGLSTGLISTSALTHATPASFIAHQVNRVMYEEIAADFLLTGVDVLIGGGWLHFTQRKDGRNLATELEQKGYHVLRDWNEMDAVMQGKLACFTAELHDPPVVGGRGDMLATSTRKAMELLSQNNNGFFLMVEGSQIDWAGHANNMEYLLGEMIDFDRAIAAALGFAEKDGNTLVVITADHETGGLALTGGSIDSLLVQGSFCSTDHTASMVPVFSFGPGADQFSGILDNTEFFGKFSQLFGFVE